MASQIRWHTFDWGYDSRGIRTVEGLQISHSVDVERNEEKEGKPATQTIALSLATVSFSYKIMSVAGGNPRKEWQEIDTCLGMHAPLFLNGARFPVNELILKSVDASNWELDGRGRAISVEISLNFEEYAVEASGLKASKVVNNSALRPGIQTAPAPSSALSVGANSVQKISYSESNGQMARW